MNHTQALTYLQAPAVFSTSHAQFTNNETKHEIIFMRVPRPTGHPGGHRPKANKKITDEIKMLDRSVTLCNNSANAATDIV